VLEFYVDHLTMQGTVIHIDIGAAQGLLKHQMKPGVTREAFSRILRQQTQE